MFGRISLIVLFWLAVCGSAQDKNDRLFTAVDAAAAGEKPSAPRFAAAVSSAKDSFEAAAATMVPAATESPNDQSAESQETSTAAAEHSVPKATTTKPLIDVTSNKTTVATKYGNVHGFTYLIGVAPVFGPVTADVFLGIPFAKPPVDQLRFEKPEAPEPFDGGELNAVKFPKACSSFAPLSGEPMFSEDCLYLNVIAPPKVVQSAEGFPVVVWIHGGGFASGASAFYGYKELATNFVSRGIVVVTIQYRLGMFGFMSSGDKAMPGNLGLWDQRAALLWVNENIRQFGGDPKRITLWGENAGSASVGALSLSRATRDLFSQAIEMSGSVFSGWAVSDSVVDTSRTIAKHLNCPTKVSKKMKMCLKAKPAEEISRAGAKLSWLRDDVNFVRMQPRIDGDFFEASLDALLAEAPKKPTIQGFNSQESMVLTMPFPGAPIGSSLIVKPNELNTFNRDRLVQFINKTVIPDGLYGEQTAEVRDAIVRFYADRRNETYEKEANAQFYLTRYTQILSDLQYVVPSLSEVLKKSRDDWPVYLYLINYMNPRFQLPVLGTFQTYELPYLFGFSIIGSFEFDDEDRKFQQALVLSLANFIGTGNPSTHMASWPPVNAAHPFGFLDLAPQPVLRDDLMLDRLIFWSQLSEKFHFDVTARKPAKARLDF